jgi:hypothetical protein
MARLRVVRAEEVAAKLVTELSVPGHAGENPWVEIVEQ